MIAAIARSVKYSFPRLANRNFVKNSSPLVRVDQRLCSSIDKVDVNNYDEEISTVNDLNSRSSKRREFSAGDNDLPFANSSARHNIDASFEKPPDKSQKYKYFVSYCVAKKLGEVDLPNDLISTNIRNNPASNNDIHEAPLGCIYFNNNQFPNEKSFRNWIEAIDLCVKSGFSSPLGIAKALVAFSRLVDAQSVHGAKLLKTVGFGRLSTWFRYSLEQNDIHSLLYCMSITKCTYAATLFRKHCNLDSAFKNSDIDYLNGILNYSLSTFVPSRLKSLTGYKRDKEMLHSFWNDIFRPILSVEIGLDQHCPLEEETKRTIVEYAIQFFREDTKFIRKEYKPNWYSRMTSTRCSQICDLFCRWNVNELSFWSDWFQFSLDRVSKIDQDPIFAHKSLQAVLLMLLKSNADPNFLRNDADFAKRLDQEIKPSFSRYFRNYGLKFLTTYDASRLTDLVENSLRSPDESRFFDREELNEISKVLENREHRWNIAFEKTM